MTPTADLGLDQSIFSISSTNGLRESQVSRSHLLVRPSGENTTTESTDYTTGYEKSGLKAS